MNAEQKAALDELADIDPDRDDECEPDQFLSQPGIIAAVVNYLERCGIKAMPMRHYNAIIKGANLMMDEILSPYRPAQPNSGYEEWLKSDDTGRSSEFMLSILGPLAFPGKHFGHRLNAHPHDPSDFARCLGLLAAVPELRQHLLAMTKQGPVWTALVLAWEGLEALYAEELPTGKAPKLYAWMRALIEGAEKLITEGVICNG